jgi:hypothetical protein
MKKLLSLLVLMPIMVIAQTQTENYIKTTTYKTPTAISITTPDITQVNQNITYFDGLGRPVQQIAHQQSGSGKDIVTPMEYDDFGRQPIDCTDRCWHILQYFSLWKYPQSLFQKANRRLPAQPSTQTSSSRK